MRKLTIQNGKIAVCNIRKIVLLLLILLAPMFASAQTKQYYLYNIVTFEGDFDKEGVKVKVDDGKTVEKLKDGKGNRIKFNTPAAALMYFLSEGWDMYHERSKDCIVLNFRLLINQNAKKWHCRHSHFSQMQNVHLPFSMLHHAPGYGIIGTRSSDQKPLR